MSLTITLPWPNKALSPNARVHWSRKANAAKAARNAAYSLTFVTGIATELPDRMLHLWIDF